jgi:drug/metabolite transporter (DMT)-like permease
MNHLLALVGVLFISFSAVFVRLAGVSPSTSAFFRMVYALPFLLILAAATRKRDNRRQVLRWMAVGSGLILSIDLSIWHWSIGLIGAGLATVLANVQVVFVGLIGWLFLREKPTGLAFAIVPLSILGVFFTSGLGRPDAYGLNPVLGAAAGAVAGFIYAIFIVVFRASTRDGVPPAGPLLDATLGAAIGCLLIGSFDPGFGLLITWPAHGWLLALALGSQVVGWLLITTVLPRIPVLETSILLLLQPVLTVIWGLLLFVELLSPLQWLGVILVLGSIATLTLRGNVARRVQVASDYPSRP